MEKWVNIFNSKTREGSLSCPNCDHQFDEQMLYFFEPNNCPKCSTLIGFINVSPYDKKTYVIDLSRAPKIFEVIFNHLSKENHKEGFNQMKELIQLLNSDV